MAAHEQHLRRKYTFKTRAGNASDPAQVVFVKHAQERPEHVWMKAFLWALYLPTYPELHVEVHVEGEKYKPDVVAFDPWGAPRLWGEAGAVSEEKIRALARRYSRTHLVMAKWNTSLAPFADLVRDALRSNGSTRHAPFDLIRFDDDSRERFIDENGRIALSFDEVTWRRLER